MTTHVLLLIMVIEGVRGWKQGCDGVTNILRNYAQATSYNGVASILIDNGDTAIYCQNEGNNNYCRAPGRVYYGSGNTFAYKETNGEKVYCSNSGFGCDPTPGVAKQCYRACSNGVWLGQTDDLKVCAIEHDGSTCSAPSDSGRRVYFGDPSKSGYFAYKDLNPGESTTCQAGDFNQCYPLIPQGGIKSCYSLVEDAFTYIVYSKTDVIE